MKEPEGKLERKPRITVELNNQKLANRVTLRAYYFSVNLDENTQNNMH